MAQVSKDGASTASTVVSDEEVHLKAFKKLSKTHIKYYLILLNII